MNPRSSRSLSFSRDVNWPPRIWLATRTCRSRARTRAMPDVTGPHDRLGCTRAVEQERRGELPDRSISGGSRGRSTAGPAQRQSRVRARRRVASGSTSPATMIGGRAGYQEDRA